MPLRALHSRVLGVLTAGLFLSVLSPARDRASPLALAERSVAAAQAVTPKRLKKAKVRTIQPRSPADEWCIEMVSFCSGQPRRCTSSPIHVACGEQVEVKSRKEWLRCACP